MAMVFQDPMTSLNPVLRIARQLVETMMAHGSYGEREATRRGVKLLGRMGITTPERAINSYPHQFSGGMRQRVALAMGMSNEPALLIADEPTTALDVTIQDQILKLLMELSGRLGMSVILVTHDLGVVAQTCGRVAVLYAGRIVESGPVERVFARPAHPYTAGLLQSIPRGPASEGRLKGIGGTPPSLDSIPAGCPFHPRCVFAVDACRTGRPPLVAHEANHLTACLRHADLPDLAHV
jgi:oligopeptide/dipeptide ABC transporter ATP-binding protein